MNDTMQAAAKEILSWLETDAEMAKEIEGTYRYKASHNRDMPTFGDWLEKIWIPQIYNEAENFCGGYDIATVKRIAEIEYKGVGITQDLKNDFGIEEVYSYVEEGRVNLTAFCKRDENHPSDCAEVARNYLLSNGYSDAECIYDYEDEYIPISASRKFIPPRNRFGVKEVKR